MKPEFLKKLKIVVQVIGLNIGIFFILLYGINFAAVAGHQLYQGIRHIGIEAGYIVDPRALLPNYQGIEWARQYFKEVGHSRTDYTSYIAIVRTEKREE